MNRKDSKAILWENISTLMKQHYGKENLGRVARESGVGAATLTRIKEQNTSVGMDHIDKLSKALKVEPWQLISPNLAVAPVDTAQPAMKDIAPEIQAVIELMQAIPPESINDAAWAASRALIGYLPRAASSPAKIEQATAATQENTSS